MVCVECTVIYIIEIIRIHCHNLCLANHDSREIECNVHITVSLLTRFIVGEQARLWCTKSGEERKQAVCEQYAKAFSNDKAKTPRYYIDKNWPAEKYSGGCYVSVLPCGVLTSYGEALRRAEGNVYFAGTETATTWAGIKLHCIMHHYIVIAFILFVLYSYFIT